MQMAADVEAAARAKEAALIPPGDLTLKHRWWLVFYNRVSTHSVADGCYVTRQTDTDAALSSCLRALLAFLCPL